MWPTRHVDGPPFLAHLSRPRRGKRLLKIHAFCPVILLRFPSFKRFRDTPVFELLERRPCLLLGGRAMGLQQFVFLHRIIEESMVGGGLDWYRVCRLSFYLFSDDTSFVGVFAPLGLRILTFFLPYSPRYSKAVRISFVLTRRVGCLAILCYGFSLYDSW